MRTDLYIPQQTHDGPDVTQLGPARMTFVKPTNGNRPYRLDDGWTTKTRATLNIPCAMDRFNKLRRTSIIQR